MPGLDELSMIEEMAGKVGAPLLGGLQFLHGLSQEKKDKKELEGLRNPFYKIQDEYYQNKNAAAIAAGQGLPSDTKNFMTQESQRGLGSGLSAISSGGGNPNDVARLFSNYQNGIASVGAQEAQAHTQNIQYYMNANKDLAGQKTTQWAINEKQPYEAKLKELTERRAADEANKWNGLSTVVSSFIAGGTSGQNSDNSTRRPKLNTNDPFTPVGLATMPAQATPSPASSFASINPNSAPQFTFPSTSGVGIDDNDISNME